MQKLSSQDTQHLQAAYGCLGSGHQLAALAELAKIAPEFRDHPAVLVTRLSLGEAAKDWATCLKLVETLLVQLPDNPIHWVQRSRYLHELGRVQEAWDRLLPAGEKFPAFWMIPYELACFACRLGRVEAARDQLNAALELVDADSIKTKALGEPDLQPLWPEIETL
jgi:tetratricopeptide (TPR) repeat protein